ncbi:hypothetical protein ACCO45_003822 [Purpureocillium lilacinum]|uniref:Uncharacterized protein n=1 Tax=Purpureocillium lilacinum TaxID=33203 RepID=A0ACC4E0Z8_PURLI
MLGRRRRRRDPSAELHPRRATPRYFHLPFADEVPKKSVPDLVADIHEGLEEVFDRPDSRAPFIPGYANRDDAIVRAACCAASDAKAPT